MNTTLHRLCCSDEHSDGPRGHWRTAEGRQGPGGVRLSGQPRLTGPEKCFASKFENLNNTGQRRKN